MDMRWRNHDAQFAEVAAHIDMRTFSNYFNNLVKTEIDFPHVLEIPAEVKL
jgi:hypothetical protein